MNMYYYDGPVMEFDRIIANNWKGTTMAESEKKAKNNLSYQFKQQHHKTSNTKITLPGKMVVR